MDPPRVVPGETAIGDVGLDRVVCARLGAQPLAQFLDGIPERFGLHNGIPLDLGAIEAPALGVVVRRQRRDGVAAVACDAVFVAVHRHRVADGVVDPRAAQVDRCAREVDGVQPPADSVARLEHHTCDAGLAQP